MAQHNNNGALGEEIAIRYLESISYKILEKNWRFQHKEIDLIAMDGNELVILEVKFRSSTYGGEPYLAVNNKKQKNLIDAAEEYIFRNEIDLETRFDIISILEHQGEHKLEHIADAFKPAF